MTWPGSRQPVSGRTGHVSPGPWSRGISTRSGCLSRWPLRGVQLAFRPGMELPAGHFGGRVAQPLRGAGGASGLRPAQPIPERRPHKMGRLREPDRLRAHDLHHCYLEPWPFCGCLCTSRLSRPSPGRLAFICGCGLRVGGTSQGLCAPAGQARTVFTHGGTGRSWPRGYGPSVFTQPNRVWVPPAPAVPASPPARQRGVHLVLPHCRGSHRHRGAGRS